VKPFVWHSKTGKLAAEFEKSDTATWKMVEQALDFAYEMECASDSATGRLTWAQQEMVKVACNSGRLATRTYEIASDQTLWCFAGSKWKADPADTLYEEDKKTLREPFTELFGRICAPIEWVRDHCKEIK
jgi:hypothetical protein